MKKILKTSLLLLVIFMITGCSKNYMKEISYKEYKELIENKETFILEVMRTECSACKTFKPRISEVANDYKIEIKYIDIDHISDDDNINLYLDTGISGTPTTIFYNKGIEETVASRINGAVSTDKIISKFKTNGFIEE